MNVQPLSSLSVAPSLPATFSSTSSSSSSSSSSYSANTGSTAAATTAAAVINLASGMPCMRARKEMERQYMLGGVLPNHEAMLFVGNLEQSFLHADLRQLFAAHGTVKRAFVVCSSTTGVSEGYGFVELATRAEATAAKEALASQLVADRAIRVDWLLVDGLPVPTSLDMLQSRTLFLDRLPRTFTNLSAIERICGAMGQVTFCRLATSASGASRGFAFVDFASADAASRARTHLSGTSIEGVEVRMSFAHPLKTGQLIMSQKSDDKRRRRNRANNRRDRNNNSNNSNDDHTHCTKNGGGSSSSSEGRNVEIDSSSGSCHRHAEVPKVTSAHSVRAHNSVYAASATHRKQGYHRGVVTNVQVFSHHRRHQIDMQQRRYQQQQQQQQQMQLIQPFEQAQMMIARQQTRWNQLQQQYQQPNISQTYYNSQYRQQQQQQQQHRQQHQHYYLHAPAAMTQPKAQMQQQMQQQIQQQPLLSTTTQSATISPYDTSVAAAPAVEASLNAILATPKKSFSRECAVIAPPTTSNHRLTSSSSPPSSTSPSSSTSEAIFYMQPNTQTPNHRANPPTFLAVTTTSPQSLFTSSSRARKRIAAPKFAPLSPVREVAAKPIILPKAFVGQHMQGFAGMQSLISAA